MQRQVGPVALRLAVTELATACLVAFRGSLDEASEAYVTATFAEIDSPAVVNLGGLSWIDETGMSVLLHAKRRLERRGHSFSVINAPMAIRRALEEAGLGELLAG